MSSYIRQNYRLYPTKEQEEILGQWIGQARFIWNHMLNLNITTYAETEKFVFVYGMNNLLPDLKKQEDTKWLSQIPSQCLQQKCQDLDTALKRSFKSAKNRFGFPKFKSRKTDCSGIRFPSFKFEGNRIILPKMKSGIKIKMHRELNGKKGAITISRDKTGKFWASILVQVEDGPLVSEITNAVGIDLGLNEFAVTTDAEIIKNPKFTKRAQKKLKKLQRRLARKQKGSKNREKARITLAVAHQQIANQRKDFIHQHAASITKINDLIAIEDLQVKGMMKNHKLAGPIADVSWGMFIQALKWHAKKRGKHVVEISQWFPSSKTCHQCGNKKEDLTLDIRIYECDECGLAMDRDLNAAINILNEGLKVFNTAGTAEINACGDMNSDVRNSAQEALSSSDAK